MDVERLDVIVLRIAEIVKAEEVMEHHQEYGNAAYSQRLALADEGVVRDF